MTFTMFGTLHPSIAGPAGTREGPITVPANDEPARLELAERPGKG